MRYLLLFLPIFLAFGYAVAQPTVTSGNISITTVGSGGGGEFIIGDDITVEWDNTAATGDNNPGVISVTIDFSQFGGPAASVATNTADVWAATYTVAAGSSSGSNLNASVAATDGVGPATTTGTDNITVCVPPVINPALNVTVCSDDVTGVILSTDGITSAIDYEIVSISVDPGLVAGGGNATVPASNVASNYISSDTYTNPTSVSLNVVYEVQGNSAPGCTGSSEFITITVDPEPVYTGNLNTTVCSDGVTGAVLPATDDDGDAITSYDVAAVVGGGLTGAASTAVGTANVNLIAADVFNNVTNAADIVTYTITPYFGTCSGTDFNIVVTVNPSPTFSVTNNIPTTCSGDITDISLSSPTAGATVTLVSVTASDPAVTGYSPAGSTFAIYQDPVSNPTGSPQTVTYTFDVAASGCPGPGTQDAIVTIAPAPTLTVSNNIPTINSGELTNIALNSSEPGEAITLVNVVTSDPAITGMSAAGGTYTDATVIQDFLSFELPLCPPGPDFSGTYNVSTDPWCGGTTTTTVDIINQGNGVYSFSDWSFGGYPACYSGFCCATGDFTFVENCGYVTINDGSDSFGDYWTFSSTINGNDWIITWQNTTYSGGAEQGTSTINFPGGVPFILAPTVTYSFDVSGTGCPGPGTQDAIVNVIPFIDTSRPALSLSYDDSDGIVQPVETIVITATLDQVLANTPLQLSFSAPATVGTVDMVMSTSTVFTYTYQAENVDGFIDLTVFNANDGTFIGSGSIGIDNANPKIVLSDDHPDDIVKDLDVVVITATFEDVGGLASVPAISIENGNVASTNMTATADPLVMTYRWIVPDSLNSIDGPATVTITATDIFGNSGDPATGTVVYTIDNSGSTGAPVFQVEGCSDFLWTSADTGVDDFGVGSMATDSQGNIYVFNRYSDPVSIGDFNLQPYNRDLLIAKYTPDGDLVWYKSFPGNIYTYISGDVRDGFVYAGFGFTEMDFLDGNGFVGQGVSGYKTGLLKLDLDGNILYNKTYFGNTYVLSAKADSEGNLYISGRTSQFIVASDTIVNDNPYRRPVLIKFGPDGNYVWGRYGNVNNSGAWKIQIDRFDNPWVLGSLIDELIFGNLSVSGANTSRFLARFDPSGNVLMLRGIDSYQFGFDVDDEGNVYYMASDLSTYEKISKTDQMGNELWSYPISPVRVNSWDFNLSDNGQFLNFGGYATGTPGDSIDFNGDKIALTTDSDVIAIQLDAQTGQKIHLQQAYKEIRNYPTGFGIYRSLIVDSTFYYLNASSPMVVAQKLAPSYTLGTFQIEPNGPITVPGQDTITLMISAGQSFPVGSQFQWYQDGFALSGFTGDTYLAIGKNQVSSSEFQAYIFSGDGCSVRSNVLTINFDVAGSGVSEQSIIESLYNNYNGPFWTNAGNWFGPWQNQDWYGITFDANGMVEKIELPGNNLNIAGPEVDLGQLPNLRKLNLSGNRYGYSAPFLTSFSPFQNLDSVDFSNMELRQGLYNLRNSMNTETTVMDVSGNMLRISDFLSYLKDFKKLTYYPQLDTVFHAYYKVSPGEDIELKDSDAGGYANGWSGVRYQWYKDGVLLADTLSTLEINNMDVADYGVYHEVLTHPDFPLLTHHVYYHINDLNPPLAVIPEGQLWTGELLNGNFPANEFIMDPLVNNMNITRIADDRYFIVNFMNIGSVFLFIDGDSIIAKNKSSYSGVQTRESLGYGKGYITNDTLYIPFFSFFQNWGDTARFTISGSATPFVTNPITNLSVGEDVNKTNVLQWDHDGLNELWFTVEYSLNNGPFTFYEKIGGGGSATLKVYLTDLQPASGYDFRVVTQGYDTVLTSSTVSLTTRDTQTVQIDPVPDDQLDLVLVDLAGTSSSGLPVSFSVFSGKARIVNGNQLQKLGAGPVVVQAGQAGDNFFLPADPDTTSLLITPGPQEIVFDSIPGWTYLDGKFKINATGGPSGEQVIFTVTSGDAGVVSGDSLIITGTGEISITASLGGNNDYLPAGDVTQTLCITAGSPEIIANGDVTFCLDSVALEAPDIPGVSYTWQVNGIDIDSANAPVYTTSVFGIYSLKLSTACGITYSSNEIELASSDSPIPVLIAAAGQSQLCDGDSVKLFVVPEAGIQYQWFQDDLLVGDTIPEYYAKADGNYTLALSNQCGTSYSSNSFLVEVLENPGPPEISAQGGLNICEGEVNILSVPFLEDANYEWFRNGVKIPFEFGNALEVSDSGTYHVEVFNLCTRVGSQDTVRIGVAPKAPSAQTIQVTGLLQYCVGDSTLLSLETIEAGMNYAWYRDDTILVEVDTTAYYASEAGTYHVEISNACRAVRSTNDIFLDVISPPQVKAITTNRNPVLCEGDSIALNIPLEPRVDYTWFKDDSQFDTGENRITVSSAGKYRVEMSNQCGSAASVNVFEVEVIFPLDIPAINAATNVICVGDMLALETDSLKYADYRWYFNGTPLTENANVLMVQDTGSYQVEIENLCYKSEISQSFNVRFHPLPIKPEISLFVNDDCTSREYKLTAEAGYSAYQWIFESATLTGAVQPEYDVLLDGFYTVGAWDTNGCYVESDPLEVFIKEIPRPTITSQGDPDSLLSTIPADEYQWFVNNMYIVGANKRDLEVLYNGIYKVSVLYPDGCIGFSNNFHVDSEEYDDFRSVAIYTSDTSLVLPKRHEIDFNLVMVYPNPANSRVNVVYDGSLAPGTNCRIFDNNGKMVREQIMTRYGDRMEAEIDVKGLPTGVYLVLIENKYKPVYQKLVIQAQ